MPDRHIAQHYTVNALGEQILAALAESGKDIDQLTVDDLGPVDAFHIRGRAATEELAAWANVQPHHELLDVGSGIGGTSRYLAATTGCRAVGVDLTEAYCQTAQMLSARVGLADQTTFQAASALDLPFDDGRFDIVWTEHVQMNIADKRTFYAQLARVLKPGGQLAFHDIFAGDNQPLHFPVPWAGDQSISHLITLDDLRAILDEIGLHAVRWEDKTEASLGFFRTVLDRWRTEGRPPLGLHLVMGEDAAIKFGNVLRNLEEQRICVVQAVMTQA